jgi:hypothetical protein
MKIKEETAMAIYKSDYWYLGNEFLLAVAGEIFNIIARNRNAIYVYYLVQAYFLAGNKPHKRHTSNVDISLMMDVVDKSSWRGLK